MCTEISTDTHPSSNLGVHRRQKVHFSATLSGLMASIIFHLDFASLHHLPYLLVELSVHWVIDPHFGPSSIWIQHSSCRSKSLLPCWLVRSPARGWSIGTTILSRRGARTLRKQNSMLLVFRYLEATGMLCVVVQ
jgi:hypothetical protein